MKKNVKLFLIQFLLIMSVLYSGNTNAFAVTNDASPVLHQQKHENEFLTKLNLSESQKEQAKELRKKGGEELKPIIQKINAKRLELETYKGATDSYSEAKIQKIVGDIKMLEKQAHIIRSKNMKEFENILNDSQKQTLKQMKEEGRNKYRQTHPPQPFQFSMPTR